jgi:6,7-dimethyl-8-ribityllumazine synthase
MNDDSTRFDPFEDTGDWPFRESPPRQEPPAVERRSDSLFGTSPAESTVAETSQPDEPLAEDDVPSDLREEPSPPDRELEQEPEQEPEPEEPEPVEADAPEVEEHDEAASIEAGLAAPVPAEAESAPAEVDEEEPAEPPDETAQAAALAAHAPGTLVVPPDVDTMEGGAHGFRRNVAIVVGRFNGDITTKLLQSAVDALRDCNVANDAITVVPVPGAFELPLAALALAKTRRFACVVALGCVIRGETAHFDLIGGEAASGLQLAAIETGIPVSFGVLTCDTREQAEARVDRGGDAARTALEMADLFSQVRTRAAAGPSV